MIRRITWFGLVGIGNTILYYLVSLALTPWLNVFWANCFGFAVAVCTSYYGHHRVTFAAVRKNASHRQRSARYAVTTLIAFVIAQAILYVAVVLMQLPPWLGLAAVVAVVPAFNFLLYQFWVFVLVPQERGAMPSSTTG